MIFIASLLFAFLCSGPELYSLYKNRRCWIPSNVLPYALGDDYHYFSIQNIVHSEVENFCRARVFNYHKLSANTKLQILSYALCEPFYAFGTLILDKRYGVLFVKLAQKYFYFLSSYLFVESISQKSDIFIADWLPLSLVLLNFLLWPCLCNLFAFKNSILLNIHNKNHILFKADHNDLVRSLFSGVSGPCLLFSFVIFFNFDLNSTFSLVLNLSLIAILFFIYMPTSVVFAMSTALNYLAFSNYFAISLNIVLLLVLLRYYALIVAKDNVGSELFASKETSLISFRLSSLLVISTNLIFALITGTLFKFDLSVPAYCIIVVNVIFSFSLLLTKHQYSRFWDRGSLIPSHLVYLIAIFFAFDSLFNWSFPSSLPKVGFLLLVLAFSYYIARQSSSLESFEYYYYDGLRNKDTKLVYALNNFSSIHSVLEDAYYNWMYGDMSHPLNNYSIGTLTYEMHISRFIAYFKNNNFSSSHTCRLFLSSLGDVAFMSLREQIIRDSRYDKSLLLSNPEIQTYCWQFALTNMSFNGKLKADGLYIDSHIQRDLFSRIWSRMWNNFSGSNL